MMRVFWLYPLILLLALMGSGCSKFYLSVQQQWIDSNYLASVQVNTPDPRKAKPLLGQKLIIEWYIPSKILKQNPKAVLDLILWDYTTRKVIIPIKGQLNYATYELLNEDYEKTEGILSYKAQIVTEDGTVFRESRHQLWVNLITIDEE